MSTETNKQIARSFLQSVDDVDFEAWRATASSDLVASANGGDVMNREEFEEMTRGIVGGFSNGRHIIESQVAEGDRVATRLTWTALHTGEFNGLPASNRPVRVCGDAFDRIEDGKVVEHHAQFDVMGMMVQIGAVPVPG
jgi:predicted ester cyclase